MVFCFLIFLAFELDYFECFIFLLEKFIYFCWEWAIFKESVVHENGN